MQKHSYDTKYYVNNLKCEKKFGTFNLYLYNTLIIKKRVQIIIHTLNLWGRVNMTYPMDMDFEKSEYNRHDRNGV